MSERKAGALGPPNDGDDRGDSKQRSPAQLVAAERHGEEQTEAAATESSPSASTQISTTTTSATAPAAVRPFDRLATVELQFIMRRCDKSTLVALACCSRFILAAASHPFVWQPLSPIDLRCDWPLELSGRLQPEASLLRHADISVTWRLRSMTAVDAEQVTSLAALPRLSGVAFESAYDPAAHCSTQLSDEGAALLFEALRERIGHGGALTSLGVIGHNIGQAGGAALAAFIKCSRSLASLKIMGASDALLASLSTALAQSRTLTSLELRSENSSPETTRALATAIKQNTSLTTVKLSHFRQDGAAAALAAALAHSRSLTDLQLKLCALGDAGVKALAAAMEKRGCIRSLNLSRNSFGAASTTALAHLLASDRCALTSLKVSYNDIGPEGALALADALQTNRTLTELCLCNSGCGDGGIRALLMALRRNPQCCLRVLGLSSNPLSASCAHSLGGVISRSLTLERLELRGCDLGNEAMAALAVGIGPSRSLQHLDVSWAFFDNLGAAALAAAVATCPSLTSLDVSDNQIGDAGLVALAPALINVRTLNLNRCQSTAGGARSLAALIQRSRVLESLDVSYNQLDARGVAEIAAALDASSSLRTLDLQSESGSGARGTTAVAAALSRGWKASKLWLSNGEPIDDSGTLALAVAMERLGSRCPLTSLSLSGCGMTAAGALSVVQAATQAPRLRELRLHFVPDANMPTAESDLRELIAACGPQPHFELKITPWF